MLQLRFKSSFGYLFGLLVVLASFPLSSSAAADKLVGLYSAHGTFGQAAGKPARARPLRF